MQVRHRRWAVLAAAVAAASALALVAFPTLKERLLLHATGTAAVDAATTATASTSAATFAALDASQWPADARVRFSDWSSIGADALPNAVVSVVAAGDRMYAMGEVGSIYESTDEAASWQQVAFVTQKQYRPLTMKQLVVLPATESRQAVYFAIDGTSAATFYRVTGGETQQVMLGNPNKPWESSVWRLAVIGQSVYAAAELGIYRTDDAGETWVHVLATTDRCKDVVGAGTRIYASCIGLYRSTAGGAFELVNNQTELYVARLAVSPKAPDTVYAASSYGIYRSLDAGQSWTHTIDFSTETNPVHQSLFGELEATCEGEYPPWGSESLAFAVDPDNASVVWVGNEQLYRSDDGAQSFGRASIRLGAGDDTHGLPKRISQPVFRSSGLYVPTATGVYRTTNRNAAVQYGDASICTRPEETPAVTWAPQRQGINGQQFREVAVSGDGSVLATTATDPGFFYTDLDAPEHWMLMGDDWPRALYVDTSGGIDRFYADPCLSGRACRFDANQSQWNNTKVADFGFGGLSFVAPDPANSNRVWAGIGSAIYRSDDGLVTGTVVGYAPGCSPASLIAVSPADPNIVVVATPCAVSRRNDALSLNQEVEWPAQRLRPSPVTFNALVFDRANPNRVYLTARGEPSVFLSKDAGLTWSSLDAPGDADGLPDSNVVAIATDPEVDDIVYLGTEQGGLYVGWNVDAAGNGGRVWYELGRPFRGAPIQQLAVSRQPDGSRRLHVFTNGAGLWTVDTEVARFSDVAFNAWAYDYVVRLHAAGITSGCSTSPLRYCPEAPVSREQMAVFLLKAMHGGSYQPPPASGYFADVPAGYWAADWIERLLVEGITTGCAANPARYCPTDVITRDQMAVLLLRAEHGIAYQPPAATGTFADVPANHWAAAWIEQLAREGITGGCSSSPALYCPGNPVTREQMAVFLVKAFGL